MDSIISPSVPYVCKLCFVKLQHKASIYLRVAQSRLIGTRLRAVHAQVVGDSLRGRGSGHIEDKGEVGSLRVTRTCANPIATQELGVLESGPLLMSH